MNPASTELTEQLTQHGLLVAMGHFAQETGLVADLMQVHIPQKTRGTPPQTKLVEFAVGLLGGIEYLRDLNLGAQPIVNDAAVAQAWDQPHWLHYASVSRTLAASDELTLSDLRAAIDRFNHPFIAEALTEELLADRELEWDLDLLGQAVSPTSTTYSGVAFGWMDDQVRLGYQLARLCMHTQRYGRLWLEGFHYPGDTAAVHCARALIQAAEHKTGVRPRRRPELVAQRVAAVQQRLQREERYAANQQARLAALEARQQEQIGQQYHLTQERERERGPARRARISRQLEAIQRRLPRLAQQHTQDLEACARRQARVQHLRAEREQLQAWQAQLEADNTSNPNPPVIVLREDGAFCSGVELTWQIEMGYQIETKSGSGKIREALRRRAHAPRRSWARVGDNAEMQAWEAYTLRGCPYPLGIALERFVQPGRTPRTRYSVLLMYRDTPTWPTLPKWFGHYNHRQTIEAGNKQMQVVHHVQHLMSRDKVGIEIQVLLTGLGCNLTHVIQPWLRAAAETLTPQLAADLHSPKNMVRVLANSAASVQHTPCSTVVAFAPASSVPEVKLRLHGLPLHQLSLGLFQPVQFAA